MKRNKRQRNYKTTTSTELDYMRVVKISVGVLIVFALVLIGSKIAMGEIKFNKKTEEKETVINYQEIIAGQTFNRKEDEYYVLFYNFSDKDASYYQSLMQNYQYKTNHLSIYTVDLEKKMNSVYAEESLEVSNPTLLKISNSEVSDRYAGKDSIVEFFNN